jgi:hypothetical protein
VVVDKLRPLSEIVVFMVYVGEWSVASVEVLLVESVVVSNAVSIAYAWLLLL